MLTTPFPDLGSSMNVLSGHTISEGRVIPGVHRLSCAAILQMLVCLSCKESWNPGKHQTSTRFGRCKLKDYRITVTHICLQASSTAPPYTTFLPIWNFEGASFILHSLQTCRSLQPSFSLADILGRGQNVIDILIFAILSMNVFVDEYIKEVAGN